MTTTNIIITRLIRYTKDADKTKDKTLASIEDKDLIEEIRLVDREETPREDNKEADSNRRSAMSMIV